MSFLLFFFKTNKETNKRNNNKRDVRQNFFQFVIKVIIRSSVWGEGRGREGTGGEGRGKFSANLLRSSHVLSHDKIHVIFERTNWTNQKRTVVKNITKVFQQGRKSPVEKKTMFES